jgi:Cu+-exporting ATPase
MGISSAMVTGDNQITAEAVGRMIGINRVIAGVLPDEKEYEVSRLQQKGEVVAFVGDGINDAPALARADAGVAIGSGTDVAIDSADIVLVRDEITDSVAAFQLGRAVMGRIRLNLFWAFAYNIVLIPLAAGILTPTVIFRPEYGALAMALSSVTVISLSLLLRGYTPAIMEKQGKNQARKTAKDLVCGMDVEVSSAKNSLQFEGKTYYFCNPVCKETFTKDPQKFISGK